MTFEGDDVDEALADWCERELGAPAVRVRWHLPQGIGGVELAGGRLVVVRVHGPGRGAGELAAVAEVQAHLAACWYPCARPLAGPSPFGRGWATAESVIVDHGPPRPDARDLVSAVAALARLVRYTDHAVHASHLAALRVVGDRTATGGSVVTPNAELLAIADAARAADRTRPVVTHLDWSAATVRADARGPSAVFGLDRLAFVPDSFGAGRAAATWAWSGPDGEGLGAPSAIAPFLDVYQQVRGYRFRPDQVRAAWGSALRVWAELGAADELDRHADELVARATA